MNLLPCLDMTVENAYIITLKDNQISEELSQRCQQSCREANQPYKVWYAFDGTKGDIVPPDHVKGESWLNWIKLYDLELSKSEVACALSHISLWAHCLTINKPIIILEHDAIVIKNYPNHIAPNHIAYLGCHEQAMQNWNVTPTPPVAAKNENYRYMLRAHAYAIDPMMAKNLLSYFIKYGICESLDISIRLDEFAVIQPGLYAFDLPHQITTITDRKKKLDGSER